MYYLSPILAVALMAGMSIPGSLAHNWSAEEGFEVGIAPSSLPNWRGFERAQELTKREITQTFVTVVARKNSPFATTSTSESSTSTTDSASSSSTGSNTESGTDSSSDSSTTSTSDSSSSTDSSTSTDSASSTSTSSTTSSTSSSTTTSSSSSSSTSSSTSNTTVSTIPTSSTTAVADSNYVPYNKNGGEIAITVVLLLFLIAGIALITRWQVNLYLARRRDRAEEAAIKSGTYRALPGDGEGDLEAPTANTLNMRELPPPPTTNINNHEIATALTPTPLRPQTPRNSLYHDSRSHRPSYHAIHPDFDPYNSPSHSRISTPSPRPSPFSSHSHSRNPSAVSDPATYIPSHTQHPRRSHPSLARSDSFERSITPPTSAISSSSSPILARKSLPSSNNRPHHQHQHQHQHTRSPSSSHSTSSLRREFSFDRVPVPVPAPVPTPPVPAAMERGVGMGLGMSTSPRQVQFVPKGRVKSFSADVVGRRGGGGGQGEGWDGRR